MHLIGIHAPNSGFTEADYDVIRLMRPQSAKLLQTQGTQHTEADLEALRGLGVQHFTMRLRDSREPDGHYPSDWEYANRAIATIKRFYDLGVRDFQLDNEPQYNWTTQEYGPFQYVWWCKHVVAFLRLNLPADVRLISPPLSFSPALWQHGPQNPTEWTLDEWLAAFMWTDGGNVPSLFSLFERAGANCYFQSERQMRDPSFGESWETVSQKAGGKHVVVTEWASSAQELIDPETGEPRYTLAQVDALRRAQYSDWQARAQEAGVVEASYVYLVGGTEDWAGYRLTPLLARAMRPAGSTPALRAAGGNPPKVE